MSINASFPIPFEYTPLLRYFLEDLTQYEVVHPTRVDAKGHFLSNFLPHHVSRIQRREASEESANSRRVFYQLWHGGHSLHFNLTLNPHLLAPGFLTERRYGGLDGAKFHASGFSQCHFLGEVWDEATVRGRAAISTCDGLTGLFKLSNEEFFIRPLEQSSEQTTAPQAHVIYKRHVSPSTNRHGVFEDMERQRERWERRRHRKRRIRQRSVSKEKWVETLVVADSKMVEYHGSKAVENYVLAVMNIVSGLFRDASIGNAINIVVVRLILLEQDEDDLKITHHADNSLNSFCKWQKRLNMKGDDHPLHHDVAVLLTRKDICAAINTPCETLGLSHVAGMCQPHRSCSVSEDTGLPLAFTVAHELGHNFGIQHDGNGNDCEPVGKKPFVMSPHLLYGTTLPSWSRCSRQYITRFLDRGWGWCLDDVPVKDELSLNSILPGVLYSAAHQCRLQYGSGSVLCDDVDNICSTLWCTVGATCHSKLDGAVDGTTCGEGKWCFGGECVPAGYHPESVNGGWAPWSEWSACSRTCGAGVQRAQRDCVNPVPKYRGKYCVGERQRYKICKSTPCLQEQPTFRDMQCSHFNTMPYKGKLYKWVAVNNRVNPCELHCRPLNEYFSEKMLDAVTDGTQCYEGSKTRDMCINGICKNVGCDYVIDSNAVEDRCGVCQGNGSTCETVRRTFEESEGLGYVDIGLIPEGAWDIRIEEVAEAGNFLALRSDNPNKYFLNGGWTIQWNGDYKAAGTVFTYERTGHLENLTSPGPTMEPLWIQLLFQETNPGVRYEYTISREVSEDNSIPVSVFFWKYGSWTECSVTCGVGVQRQTVHCVEKTSGIVEEHFCDPSTRPDDKQASCNKELCPAIWWTGEWHKCSASCGNLGLTKRTVICIQAVSVEEQRALQPTECKHMPKPPAISSCNTHIPCPADWTTSSWSECSLTCGSGTQHRNVTCSRNTGIDCDPQKKPIAITPCYLQDCPQVVDISEGNDWSGSGWSSKEVFNEINSIPEANPLPKYSTTRAQPKDHNNLNNFIEADFSHPNHIENTKQNNVQVDDFYYDYNFINFHEDLYDFDSGDNGKDTGESHGSDLPPEAKTNHSMKENIYKETTSPPTTTSDTSTVSKTTAYSLKIEKPQDINLDDVEENGKPPTKNSVAMNPEIPDVFLSEDYFLPVSTTSSPPFSPTKFSQTLKEKHKESPEPPLGSPSQEKGFQFETQLDESTTEIPQTTSLSSDTSKIFSTALILGDSDADQTDFNDTNANSQGNSWVTDRDLTVTSLPASQESTTLPLPTQPLSGNQEYSDATSSKTGTDFLPSTELEGGTQPSPFYTITDSQPGTTEQVPTKLTLFDRTTPRRTNPRAPSSYDWIDFDYNEIVIPPVLPDRGNSRPCSTSCGLGAIWRALSCSTGSESDCDPTKRPVPARRCYLRPCSTWKMGEWSKCSKNCGGGVALREVQCFDMRDQRPLRPFHCQAISPRPRIQMPCNPQPCLDWYTSSWGQCSEVCGGGEQQRMVTCPEEDGCDKDFCPSNIQSCNSQPCAQWLSGSWGQCSASCGGGVQRRLIKCVNTKAETEEEVDQVQCDYQPQPETIQKCNLHECETRPPNRCMVCHRDRLTFRFCQTLYLLGHCHMSTVRAQCCKTCSQRTRGNNHTSRR
uniref:ADAM metallopeptidase with thrombospondin type 1 motif 7 n=1 Tax=Myripristis murdjan TaxID=586833 RepID=A0A667ZEZ3_9TELE